MAKLHVAVLSGGMSAEHEVSLVSGEMAAKHLLEGGYDVTEILVRRDGLWQAPSAGEMPLPDGLRYLRQREVDCVFIALHGPFGEDGRIQGMLDLAGIPYTGSGCAASALAMEKVHSKAVARDAGIRVAEQLVVGRREWREGGTKIITRIAEILGLPCVIKCPSQGSSIGMSIPKSEADVLDAMAKLFELETPLLIEQYLRGIEVTCGVLDIHNKMAPRALPVTEIAPKSAEFFDYQSKYTPGATEEITPARISDEEARLVQEASVRAHEAIGCSGFSRSDFIIVGGTPYWLEVNTIPGLTPTSLFPQAAAAAGISFTEFVGLLVEDGIVRQKTMRPKWV